MSDCKPSHPNLKPPPIAHVSSLSKTIVTSKKAQLDENNLYKRKLAEFGQVLAENELKKLRYSKPDGSAASSSFDVPSFSKYSSHPLSLASSKLMKYDNPIINCDKYNSSTMAKSISQTSCESDMPLNLCVKRPSSSQSESKSPDNHQPQSSSSTSLSSSSLSVNSTSSTLYSKSEPLDDHLVQPKKRGRKLKSLLASSASSNLPVIVIPSPSENKPRNRGRSPILSNTDIPSCPEDKSNSNSLIETHSISANIVPNVGALQSNSNSKFTNDSASHPGWPSFVPSDPLYFPSNLDEDDSNQEAKQDNSYNVSGDSEEETDDDCDDDSDSCENDEKSLGEKRSDATSDIFNEEELRKPLKFGSVNCDQYFFIKYIFTNTLFVHFFHNIGGEGKHWSNASAGLA